MSTTTLAALLLSFSLCFAEPSWALNVRGDADLTKFVTRPDIKAPLFEITHYDEAALAPGLWFLGPYAHLFQSKGHPKLHQPCQTGPHIYTHDGELVWSGACTFDNRVACDVRSFRANGSAFVTAIIMPDATDPKGHGVIMNDKYDVVSRIQAPPGTASFNMHELTMVDNGSRAVYLVTKPRFVDMAGLISDTDSGWIVDMAILEIDLQTGLLSFEWWASDHIGLSESSAILKDYGMRASGWDWLHINSVTKNHQGDFLMSARYTDCIYKISGQNGNILWRLGGTNSDFALVDFNFSRQHDAQWLEHNETTEIISFLDNGADDHGYFTSNMSSALVVRLESRAHQPHAKLVQRIWRPDGGISHLRGNFQILPNGNRLISWSENAYITEHAEDGRLLMSASFKSERFVTYRVHKLPFEGFPTEKPRLHAVAYRAGESAITSYSVSWNGATNVATWRFWQVSDANDDATLIGEAPHRGFETAFQSQGCETRVFAEALDRAGWTLGTTSIVAIPPPALPHLHVATDDEAEHDEL
ncbi:hypothetical protein DOTSEDRAFT_129489 [Dothistroma septosporum NZE10]|uniref:ASST-domain-containing protein n=1 Tax=Dothistroma septosporum (strain NZE10 / CBS 128990) TaxID=675120 RepID=N1PP81_DOTSN|nr:hypothetical protein DOTSEDRAFT_129489 [Dothistroma septosporum NZE10]